MFIQSFVQYNNISNLLSVNTRFGLLNDANTGLFIVFNILRDRDILDEIKQTLLEHKIDEIVIGYPIGLNAHETRMSNVVDEFIENDLKSITNIPIHKIDERMTSKLTNDNSVRNDDLAALEILNSYLKV